MTAVDAYHRCACARASARRLLQVAVLGALLAGCISAPEPYRHYTLLPPDAALQTPAAPDRAGFYFTLRPIEVPAQVNATMLVVRRSPGEVQVLDTHRWSAPLPDELSQALSLQLGSLLGTLDVGHVRAGSSLPVYRLRVHVRRFEIALGRQVLLDVNWSLAGGRTPSASSIDAEIAAERAAVLTCSLDIRRPVGATLDNAVVEQQLAVQRLAEGIASSLQAYHLDPATAACPSDPVPAPGASPTSL